MLAAVKLSFIAFGPLCLRRLLFHESIRRLDYVVPLGEEIRKTILVRKVTSSDLVTTNAVPLASDDSGRTAARPTLNSWSAALTSDGGNNAMHHFRSLIRQMPTGSVVTIGFRRLHLTVDHRELISETSVPVNLLRFFYDVIFRCQPFCAPDGVEPLRSCCVEGILGTWSPRFLWFRLLRHSDCNRGCRECCPWSRLLHIIGGLLLVAALPFPFYIRLILYYIAEADEMADRRAAVDRLGWRPPLIDYNVLQWLGPSHPAFLAVYAAYFASTALLVALRSCDKLKVDAVIRGCAVDMRALRRSEVVRMLVAHVVLPFEKFGCIAGPVVAAVYWPLVLPLCLIVAAFYCLPVVYVTGRLLIGYRPAFLSGTGKSSGVRLLPHRHHHHHQQQPPQQQQPSLAAGVSSVGSLFFLDAISPSHRSRRGAPDVQHQSPTAERTSSGRRPLDRSANKRQTKLIHAPEARRRRVTDACFKMLVGVMSIVFVYTLLLMYAEALGFLIEVCLLTVLGVVLNIDQSAILVYLVLFSWSAVYLFVAYRQLYACYVDASSEIFRCLREHLQRQVTCRSLRDHTTC